MDIYMFFLVDEKKKIIFGWSAKCGCSHIKTIFYYLKTGNLKTKINTGNDINKLPKNIEKYTTIIITRNPYERVISGFLDKYKKHGQYRFMWKDPFLSFSQFVDTLIKANWNIIDKHHFTPQTTEHFNEKILLSKIIKLYDINKIDYNYIGQLYKKIPEFVLNKKQGHERRLKMINSKCYNDYVYNLNIDEYINYNVDTKYFYNEEIMKKVYNFYISDFNFFKKNGMNYIKTKF